MTHDPHARATMAGVREDERAQILATIIALPRPVPVSGVSGDYVRGWMKARDEVIAAIIAKHGKTEEAKTLPHHLTSGDDFVD